MAKAVSEYRIVAIKKTPKQQQINKNQETNKATHIFVQTELLQDHLRLGALCLTASRSYLVGLRPLSFKRADQFPQSALT